MVKEANTNCFIVHFSLEPQTIKDLLSDLCNKYPDTKLKETIMGLNWLKLYDINLFLSAIGTMMNLFAETNAVKLSVLLHVSD